MNLSPQKINTIISSQKLNYEEFKHISDFYKKNEDFYFIY